MTPAAFLDHPAAIDPQEAVDTAADYSRFGRVLRARRDELRLSQEALAEKAEINRSYLGEIERASAVPSLATMAKLAKALDIRLSALLARCE